MTRWLFQSFAGHRDVNSQGCQMLEGYLLTAEGREVLLQRINNAQKFELVEVGIGSSTRRLVSTTNTVSAVS
jgi:hypothetical protein